MQPSTPSLGSPKTTSLPSTHLAAGSGWLLISVMSLPTPPTCRLLPDQRREEPLDFRGLGLTPCDGLSRALDLGITLGLRGAGRKKVWTKKEKKLNETHTSGVCKLTIRVVSTRRNSQQFQVMLRLLFMCHTQGRFFSKGGLYHFVPLAVN